MIDQGRCAAIKLGEDNVQVEGLAVTFEARKAGVDTGTTKTDPCLRARGDGKQGACEVYDSWGVS